MNEPDYLGAKTYALARLANELPANLKYHNLAHTRDDVLPAAERLAASAGVYGIDLLLLLTAAAFHDIGFVGRYADHESLSIQIASEALPQFGYRPEQIQVVCEIIQATRLPQQPQTLVEQLMADADLDVLGRDDLLERNQALRVELADYGRLFSDLAWYSSQLEFFRGHHYFTAAARALRDEKKAENTRRLEQIFRECCQGEPPATAPALQAPVGLSIAERTAILRAVGLFAETPETILAEVAAMLTPVNLEAGETVFHKGDPGDCMYIIVQGKIQTHDGEMPLSLLGPADFFGEMALLDTEPRMASATSVGGTRLLRLGHEQFYQLLAQQPDFARGVIRVLNRRLRVQVRDRAEEFLYIQQVGKITAAAGALEAGVYDAAILDEVGERSDELGQLARVFQRMANEVQAREKRLKQELQALRFEIDEVKKARQVAEITESEYFLQLQSKIQRIKNRPAKP